MIVGINQQLYFIVDIQNDDKKIFGLGNIDFHYAPWNYLSEVFRINFNLWNWF